MPRVLVIEDEKRLLRSIRDGLLEEGYEAVTSLNGEAALGIIASQSIDLVILDLMLPGMHGLDVLQNMRSREFTAPILILTACDRVRDRVAGLNGGADDYLVKPFSYAELHARVRTLLRRGPPRGMLELQAGHIRVDALERRAFREGVELELSRREFDLLSYLIRHRGQTVTRDMLARELWRDTQDLLTNVIDVYINRLRRKIDLTSQPSLIRTVRGSGYVIAEEE
ncbi:response regulator transcription factor [Planctomicrobium piriforme]|uniref:DNA-binding response regulator, OmpR family, contains REC and winged-helix (WHTH) domain n=1 Tax=Planctomicrobium piriforme TaxID=1576369 RepID=A0A1I3BBL7_9PLAN|nr:response regulator transcription factor [Planctomicrobium piriforme]SFH59081.1 DNA-binding response regulator, OmpR family, contains REC and winged-helix (wHTH) domain [Planctomicrobium piriforme]